MVFYYLNEERTGIYRKENTSMSVESDYSKIGGRVFITNTWKVTLL